MLPTVKRRAEVDHLEVIDLRGSVRPRALPDKHKQKLLRPLVLGVELDSERGSRRIAMRRPHRRSRTRLKNRRRKRLEV